MVIASTDSPAEAPQSPRGTAPGSAGSAAARAGAGRLHSGRGARHARAWHQGQRCRHQQLMRQGIQESTLALPLATIRPAVKKQPRKFYRLVSCPDCYVSLTGAYLPEDHAQAAGHTHTRVMDWRVSRCTPTETEDSMAVAQRWMAAP